MASTAFPWYTLLTALAVGWGACIGSFLNVCIYRIPRDLSVVRPRSACPHCGRPIAWHHNIPILSWLLLRGRGACCGQPISARYVVVEALVAGLFLLAWLKLDAGLGPPPLGLVAAQDWRVVPIYWLLVAGLVLGTFVDFEHLIIPDRVTLGGIVAGLTLSAAVPALHGRATAWEGLLMGTAGAGLGWGLLWAVALLGTWLFKKDAMGFGDVKLIGAIGAFLGWRSVVFTIVASSLIGSIVGVTLVLLGLRRMQSQIPYGPYLALAALVWMLWGPALWSAYFNLVLPPEARGVY